MKLPTLLAFAASAIAAISFSHAADIAGKWTSEFDSQIGLQKYVYTFKTEGSAITGNAAHDHSMGKGEGDLKDIKVEGDNVSFTEPLHVQDMDIVVTYSGKISGDEMKLKRVVGEWATEEIVAKRVGRDASSAAPSTSAK